MVKIRNLLVSILLILFVTSCGFSSNKLDQANLILLIFRLLAKKN